MNMKLPSAALALAAAVVLGVAGANAQAGGYNQPSTPFDLFYNFYVDGGGGVPAQLYVSPRPVPPVVGHTYITYQPLMPHEFLYKHHRTYRGYDQRARLMNKTTVRWW